MLTTLEAREMRGSMNHMEQTPDRPAARECPPAKPQSESGPRMRTVHVTRVETYECLSVSDDAAIDEVLAGNGRSVDQQTIGVEVSR